MDTTRWPLLLGLVAQDSLDVQDSWSSAPWTAHLKDAGPWVLLGIGLLVLGRALVRHRRYRAMSVLDAAAIDRVHDAIRRAEEKTVGEIVPVVLERSDPHPGASWVGAVCSLLLGSVLLIAHLPWGDPLALLACQTGLGALGFLLVRLLPDLTRLFITEARAVAVSEEQALLEFHRLGLDQTEAATGVLLFVSLAEHQVVVLGDRGIDEVMGPEQWETVTAAVLEGITTGDLARGLVDAIDACGHALQESFPWAEGDRNELPDRLEVRRE